MLLLLLILNVCAQVVFKNPDLLTKTNHLRLSLLGSPVFRVPSFDNEALAREADASSLFDDLHSGPFVFAKEIPVDVSLKDFEKIETQQNVHYYRLKFHSLSAQSLHFSFDDFQLPPDVEFYLRNDVTGERRGPFTRFNNKPHRSFVTAPILSPSVTLELFAHKRQPVDLIEFHIDSILYGFRTPFSRLIAGKSGDWMLMTRKGVGFCSGAMVNNLKQDGRQLFLTAYHCIGNSDPKDNLLLFNYQSMECNSTEIDAPTSMTAHGLKKVAQWPSSDFSLLELEERIPESYNVYLSGWTAEEEFVPANPVGIHHPSADLKKISFFEGNCSDSCWGWCNDKAVGNLNHWKIERWTRGTTEPGSSGSPLFDGSTGRISGQLHGGSASCSYKSGYDMYGKLSYSWDKAPEKSNRLQPHLDTDSSGQKYAEGAHLNDLRSTLHFQI